MSLYLRIYEKIADQPLDQQLKVLNDELGATTDNRQRIFILCWLVEKLCSEVIRLQNQVDTLSP
jgi:hypothetical protein